MILRNLITVSDTVEYRAWLEENCGVEAVDWEFQYWKFTTIYGVRIVDPEVETLFRLKFSA